MNTTRINMSVNKFMSTDSFFLHLCAPSLLGCRIQIKQNKKIWGSTFLQWLFFPPNNLYPLWHPSFLDEKSAWTPGKSGNELITTPEKVWAPSKWLGTVGMVANWALHSWRAINPARGPTTAVTVGALDQKASSKNG